MLFEQMHAISRMCAQDGRLARRVIDGLPNVEKEVNTVADTISILHIVQSITL